MKILHTSDWHLGHLFYGRRRDDEFRRFLTWLHSFIARESVDVLIVAGDVFDTGTPGNASARMYYDFLTGLRTGTNCRHVIVTGGNHDSPSFLNAPGELLEQAFDIFVRGEADPEHELLELADADGELALLVGAVPYLRDADLHVSEWSQKLDERETARRRGFQEHYRAIAEAADARRGNRPVPFVLTGHFAAAGIGSIEHDGVREFIGGLRSVEAADLPGSADYVALGHIHQSQKVGTREHIRYCGSPLRMSFADLRPREVLLIEFDGRTPRITAAAVPEFQRILTLSGNWDAIAAKLAEFRDDPEEIWIRVLADDLPPAELQQQLDRLYDGKRHNYPLLSRSLQPSAATAAPARTVRELRELTEQELFHLLLDSKGIGDPERRARLDAAFGELLGELHGEQP